MGVESVDKAGFREPPHHHKPVKRAISDLQQIFVVQRGMVAVGLNDNSGQLIKKVIQ
jgi:hypothetical protein